MKARTESGVAAGKPAAYHNESLARGMKILTLFGNGSGWLSLTDIARQAGVNTTTAVRLLSTLESMGYVERSLSTRRYRPSLSVLRLGYSALQASTVRELAQPYLERLAQTTDETVNMGVLVDTSVLYVVRLKRTELVTADIHVGSTLPAYCSSMGKLLLAYLDDRELAPLLRRVNFAKRGPNTITDPAKFRQALAEIRRKGWSVQDEETAAGLRSVAAPVRDETGKVVAAINIATPTARVSLKQMVKTLLPAVSETATRISEMAHLRSTP
jgi:IclR family pca regulon transcriptional regulator